MDVELIDDALNELKVTKVVSVKNNSKYKFVLDRIKSIKQALDNGHTVSAIYAELSKHNLDMTFYTFKLYVERAKKEIKPTKKVAVDSNKEIAKTTSVQQLEPVAVVETVTVAETVEPVQVMDATPGSTKNNQIAVDVVSEQSDVSVKQTTGEQLNKFGASDDLLKKKSGVKPIERISVDDI